MPTSTAGKGRSKQCGFTYVMVLAAVVVLGVVVETATVLSSQVKRADQEAELLYRGMAYRNAIRSYHRTNGNYPSSLQDLVRDNRHPEKHHLRAPYPDPLAPREAENGGWALVRDIGGGIRGVASVSTLEPRKKANFPKGLEKLENAKSYAQWVFEYAPESPLVPVGSPTRIGAPAGPPVRMTN